MSNPVAQYYTKDSEGSTIVASTPLELHRKHKIYHRPGTSDSKMISESFKDYETVNCKDHVVMDCGSNIGGFILKSCMDGAKSVTSYEPEPFNFEVLQHNRDIISARYPNTKIELINSALCAGDETELTFNLNAGGNSACSGSIIKTNKSFPVTVKACNFWEQLDKLRPTLIKMDIEGAEYSLLDTYFPDYVEEVAIELHGFKKANAILMFSYAVWVENNPKYKVISKKVINVFGGPAIILLHFARA